MSKIGKNQYFIVKDKHGETYLCPLTAKESKEKSSSVDYDDCVEKDIVDRYSGNIDIEI